MSCQVEFTNLFKTAGWWPVIDERKGLGDGELDSGDMEISPIP